MSNNGTSTCVLKVNFKGVWKRVKMVECFDDVVKLLHDVFKYEKTNDEKVNVFEIDMNNQKNVISNNCYFSFNFILYVLRIKIAASKKAIH